MSLQIRFLPEQVADTAFIADRTTILGDVSIGDESSVWYGTVIRGDTERIEIGRQTNIQDLSILHADPGFPCVIGDRVTIGHGAVVHGANVQSDVMIGMRATILNGAQIGSGSVVAAGAVVTEGTAVPPGSLVAGVPAKVIKSVSDRHAAMIQHAADHYTNAATFYRLSRHEEDESERDS